MCSLRSRHWSLEEGPHHSWVKLPPNDAAKPQMTNDVREAHK
jgi:hypothetical protein